MTITRVMTPAPAGEADRGDDIASCTPFQEARRRPRPPAQGTAPALLPPCDAGVGARPPEPAVAFIPAEGPRGYDLTLMRDPDPAHQITMAELRAELIAMPCVQEWWKRTLARLALEKPRPLPACLRHNPARGF